MKPTIPVSIRLVCATHQDLKQMVEVGKFRRTAVVLRAVAHIGNAIIGQCR
ncbi:sigma 54-interacting transcriptional regulator [Sulfurimicrobium lacus]|uniref:sigma 54-interacting transcriptional regulator n=1 Tax=Sulfurimicrobium lacus TaxID=2715678 RepID=UPI003CC80D58